MQEILCDAKGQENPVATYEQRQALVALRRQIVEKVFARRQYQAQHKRHAAQRSGLIAKMRDEGDQLPEWQKDDLRARAEHHSNEMGLCLAMQEQLRMECWVLYTALVDDGKG